MVKKTHKELTVEYYFDKPLFQKDELFAEKTKFANF